MIHSVKLQFESSETNVSAFCPTCNLTVPFDVITCGLTLNLDPACESYQCDVQMHHAFPYEVSDDPNTNFMGMKCPYCGGVMGMIDTGIAPVIKCFNKLKLFTEFSCEGHHSTRMDPVTMLTSDCVEGCYIKFIDTGLYIRDILLYNLLHKYHGEPVLVDKDEWSIKARYLQLGIENADFSAFERLVWNTTSGGIYAKRPESLDVKSFTTLKFNFYDALYRLCYRLPEFIRNWYENCADDDKYFFDTQQKKDKYLNVWANDITLRSVLAETICEEDSCK